MLIIREIKTFISDNAYEPLKKAMLPENKEATPGEIGHTLIQKQFLSHIRSNDSYFEMLPADFTKQDAVKQAEVLGIAERTMARWISNLVQTHDLERISHGIYRKINPINHSA